MTPPASVADYLAALPAAERAALERLRERILAAAPGATDVISYQMPAVRYGGRVLVSYAAFKDHCSLFPWSAALADSFGEELAPYRTGKGTLQFRTDAPIPDGLLERIVKGRMAEIDRRAARKAPR